MRIAIFATMFLCLIAGCMSNSQLPGDPGDSAARFDQSQLESAIDGQPAEAAPVSNAVGPTWHLDSIESCWDFYFPVGCTPWQPGNECPLGVRQGQRCSTEDNECNVVGGGQFRTYSCS